MELEGIYRSTLPWESQNSNILLKFEDLDGEQGGGNNAKQYDVVIKIINHLELTGQIPDEKLLKIDPESFGKNDYF